MTVRRQSTPEPSYDPPFAIDLVRYLMAIEAVILVGTGETLLALDWFGLSVLRTLNWFGDIELGSVLNHILISAGIAVGLLMFGGLIGLLAWGIGEGRRWARTGALMVQASISASVVATGVAQMGLDDLWGPALLLVMALLPLAPLAFPEAREWFRQGGKDPWYQWYYSQGTRRGRRIGVRSAVDDGKRLR